MSQQFDNAVNALANAQKIAHELEQWASYGTGNISLFEVSSKMSNLVTQINQVDDALSNLGEELDADS